MKKKAERILTEEKLYKMMDTVETRAEDFIRVSEGWYPTVEELKAEENSPGMINWLAPLILFFASDPYKDCNDRDYKDAVKYCQQLSVRIETVEDDKDCPEL